MTPFAFIVASLAIWRLSYGIVHEDGPLMVWARLRARLARTQKRNGGMFDMISCVKCASFWVGLVASVWLADGVFDVLVYSFAFSGVATLIEAYMRSQN